ncbi:hypothetical protein DTO271D3_3675 [Paecilomyces variotii]|nr:hypothetical protein DTO207G8_5548 [Paecilomyces variotii]KAJ9316099.1 hypothetical protein DTO271D3_3675 [Paecilomyces variotii]
MGSSSRLTPLSPSRCFKDRLPRRLHYNLFYPSLQRSPKYMPEAVVFNQNNRIAMSNDKDNEAEFARDCGADSSDAESIVRARPFFPSQSSLNSVRSISGIET